MRTISMSEETQYTHHTCQNVCLNIREVERIGKSDAGRVGPSTLCGVAMQALPVTRSPRSRERRQETPWISA